MTVSRTLCRVDRKSSIILADDTNSIRLEKKGVTRSEWKLHEIDCIKVVAPKGFWGTGYVRFIRNGEPPQPERKYSPLSDPDAIMVIDEGDLHAGADMLRRMGMELGVTVDTYDNAAEFDSIDGGATYSVRTKTGLEIARLTDYSITLDDHRIEFPIKEIAEIRVKNSAFGSRFIQIVPQGAVEAWPERAPDTNFPTAVDVEPVFGTQQWNTFLKMVESRHPDLLVRLDKRAEREAALKRVHALSEANTGERVYWSRASSVFDINIYSREIWLGDPFLKSSVGGSISGAHAEYSVSGNIITTTRTVNSMAGNTHIQRPQDMRVFQLVVTGPNVSITATASADRVEDAEVVELVNAINSASISASKISGPTQTSPIPPKPDWQPRPGSAKEVSVASGGGTSEGLRRLMKLYASGLINDEEFAQGKADLS